MNGHQPAASDPDYRLRVPSIRETAFDRAVLALLDELPAVPSGTIRFDNQICSPGSALIEPLGCCWDFGNGPTAVIERLSLGNANAWRTDWICEPDLKGERAQDANPVARESSVFRPWTVRHPDVGMSVFPTTFQIVLQGEATMTTIPAGTPIGRISYAPGGLRRFDPGQRTYAVAHVFHGFEIIFSCMDSAALMQFDTPHFCLGDAPEKRMCRFLKHFGFDLLDGGELGATVVAPVERVRASLHRNRERWERVISRADRGLF